MRLENPLQRTNLMLRVWRAVLSSANLCGGKANARWHSCLVKGLLNAPILHTPVKIAFAIILLLPVLAAQSRVSCDQWNTDVFFEVATVQGVIACLSAGADPNDSDASGWRPLHFAAFSSDASTVGALLAAGANLESRDEDGWTPLYVAVLSMTDPARLDGLSVVRTLLDAGADPNSAAYVSGNTPLHVATAWERVLQALLDAGADLTAKNNAGLTPLDVAESHGRAGGARVLRDALKPRRPSADKAPVQAAAGSQTSDRAQALAEEPTSFDDEGASRRRPDPNTCLEARLNEAVPLDREGGWTDYRYTITNLCAEEVFVWYSVRGVSSTGTIDLQSLKARDYARGTGFSLDPNESDTSGTLWNDELAAATGSRAPLKPFLRACAGYLRVQGDIEFRHTRCTRNYDSEAEWQRRFAQWWVDLL